MEEKLKCEVCGALVTRKSASQKYCASCRDEANSFKAKLHREERKAIKSYSSRCQNVDTLEEKCKEISRYNKLHNTLMDLRFITGGCGMVFCLGN